MCCGSTGRGDMCAVVAQEEVICARCGSTGRGGDTCAVVAQEEEVKCVLW